MKKEFEKRIYSSLIILPISLIFLIQGSFFFIFFLSILFLATSYEWVNMCQKKFLIRIIGIFFLIFSFYSAYKFRSYVGLNSFILVVLLCISTDIGGYVFGKFFKGPKLIKISPNKTYAGVLGSFILAAISGLIYNNYVSLAPWYTFSIGKIDIKSLELSFLIFILIISLVSQIGDLIISYFKRLAKIKDTGKIIPGHGGILDRIDGLIFAIPFSYLFIIL